jgi:RHS repeat-associated protein
LKSKFVITADHSQYDTAFHQAANVGSASVHVPNHFNNIRFSDGSRRVVLDDELDLLDDCVEVVGTVPVGADSLQYFHVELPNGGGSATLQNVLELRAAGLVLEVTAPKATDLQPGTNPNTDNQFPSVPEFTFFVYDHLGNTRVMYHNDMYDCQAFHTHYVLEHVLDYYPYGKTLREYLLDRERFETTYHERDIESGLDYRGARFYDGDVGRFLSCDPKAADFAGWSTYNYVLGNPIRFVDADRMSPVDPIDPNKHERWPFYRSFGNSAYNAVLNREEQMAIKECI